MRGAIPSVALVEKVNEMRIVDIREAVMPIASDIRNAYIDFSKMTVSVVAGRDGCHARRQAGHRLRLQFQRPLCGERLLRERFMARVLEAKPADFGRCSRRQSRPRQDLAAWP